MKFIFTADLHLKMWGDNVLTDTGIPMKLFETLSVFEDMCKYAMSNNINTIIIGGDTNDTKDVVSVKAFVLFRKILSKYPDINFHIIHGNHDSALISNCESAIHLLDGPSNVKTYTNPECIFDNILLVPFSNDFTCINHNKNIKILVSHFGLSEGVLSNGISLRTKTSLNNLKQYKLCLLGHYHKPQFIENDITKVYYVGSPIPLRRDEVNDEKRFLIIDNETLDVQSTPTEGYRKYLELEINEDNKDEILEIIKNIDQTKHKLVLKNYTKKLSYEIEEILLNKNNNISMIDLYEEENINRGIKSSMNMKEKFIKFMEISNIETNEYDEYLNILDEILEKAELEK